MRKFLTFISQHALPLLKKTSVSVTGFHGGVALPKAQPMPLEIANSFIPRTLVYPLLQRGDTLAHAVVKVGERVLKGQVIAHTEQFVLHAASSGKVSAIEPRPIPHPSGLSANCIVISTDGKEESVPVTDTKKNLYTLPQLCDLVKNAGIVGLGGAAFPTALKLSASTTIDTLIINAVECEAELRCDAALIQQAAAQIVQGIILLSKTLKVTTSIIALKENSVAEQTCLAAAIAESDAAIALISVANRYPSGSEKQLIQTITGKQVPHNASPATIGVLCLNVGTVFAIFQALVQHQPLLERVVTITGNGVANPQNRWVKIGTPIAELIAQCGGYTENAQRLIMGGAMMGVALADDAMPVTKQCNGLIVSSVVEKTAPAPCIRCGACAQVCPAQLLPQQLYGYSRAENYSQLEKHSLAACIECGCCDVVCPSHIPLVHYFRASKGKIAQQHTESQAAALAKQRYEARVARLEQERQQQATRAEKQKQALAAMKAKIAAKR